MRTSTATIADTLFTFTFMGEDGDVLVVQCPKDGNWHDAACYFSVFHPDLDVTDTLHAVMDALSVTLYVIVDRCSKRYFNMTPMGDDFTSNIDYALTFTDKKMADKAAYRLNDDYAHTPANFWVVTY